MMLRLSEPMIVGKGCPPGGRKYCTIRGSQNQNNNNVEVTAILKDDEGNAFAQADYILTEDFIDELESTMPPGFYSWYPRYAGGDIPTPQKVEELRKNMHTLLQDWLCNHAHAQMVLGAIPDGFLLSKKQKLNISLFTKDLEETFKLDTSLPSEQDFMARLQKLVERGHEEFMKQILSPHVALFYKIPNKQAESFLALLEKKGYIQLNKRAGYQIPYGSRNTADASGIMGITSAGMEYKARPLPKLDKPRCFVIMPLAGLNHQYGIIVRAWKDVFGEDAQVFHQDDDPNKAAGDLLDEKIQANIRDATMVIALLSMGEKERPLFDATMSANPDLLQRAFPLNSNVLLELGYALRCRQDDGCNCKDVLILTEKPQPFDFLKNVFDIRNRNFIPYTTGDGGEVELKDELVRVLNHLKERYGL